QEAGEFGPADPVEFAILLSALLDGLAVQIALADPTVDPSLAFELTMRFAAAQLGFTWTSRRAGRRSRARRSGEFRWSFAAPSPRAPSSRASAPHASAVLPGIRQLIPIRVGLRSQVSLMISLRKRVVPAGANASADRRFMTSR